MSQLAMLDLLEVDAWVSVEHLETLSIEALTSALSVEQKPCWMDPLIAYLDQGTLPNDPVEARWVRR